MKSTKLTPRFINYKCFLFMLAMLILNTPVSSSFPFGLFSLKKYLQNVDNNRNSNSNSNSNVDTENLKSTIKTATLKTLQTLKTYNLTLTHPTISLSSSLSQTLENTLKSIAKRTLSPSSCSAVFDIVGIVKSFPEIGFVDLFGVYDVKVIVNSVGLLSRLQGFSSLPQPEKNVANAALSYEELKRLKTYSKYANAAYGWKGSLASGRLHLSDHAALSSLLNISSKVSDCASLELIKVSLSTESKHHNHPGYFIAVDHSLKTVVLSVRGTLSGRDVLTDLLCIPESFGRERAISAKSFVEGDKKYKAHKGMLTAAKSLSNVTRSTISSLLSKNPGYALVLTGHSLGAGTSAVLGNIWQEVFDGVKVYAFGSPCVVPRGESESGGGEYDNVISVINRGDPFASLSLGHVSDVTKAVDYFCKNDELRNEINWRLDAEDSAWIESVRNDIRRVANTTKLYPPGKIFEISSFEEEDGDTLQKIKLSNMRHKHYDEIKLTRGMFDLTKHLPAVYEARLGEVVKVFYEEEVGG